jgi:hypothetical protein
MIVPTHLRGLYRSLTGSPRLAVVPSMAAAKPVVHRMVHKVCTCRAAQTMPAIGAPGAYHGR